MTAAFDARRMSAKQWRYRDLARRGSECRCWGIMYVVAQLAQNTPAQWSAIWPCEFCLRVMASERALPRGKDGVS